MWIFSICGANSWLKRVGTRFLEAKKIRNKKLLAFPQQCPNKAP